MLHCGCILKIRGSLLEEELSCCDWLGLQSVEELCQPPIELEPITRTSVALTAQCLNVRQCKLGTNIIQTVHILQLDSAATGSLPTEEDFFKHNPNYFQITQPGSSTITAPYHWRRQTFWAYLFVIIMYCTYVRIFILCVSCFEEVWSRAAVRKPEKKLRKSCVTSAQPE
jgi:hypothetical protein